MKYLFHALFARQRARQSKRKELIKNGSDAQERNENELEGRGGGGNRKKVSDDKLKIFIVFFFSTTMRLYMYLKDSYMIHTPWVDFTATHPFDSGDACGSLLSKYFIPSRDVTEANAVGENIELRLETLCCRTENFCGFDSFV